ncbi:hypothetical protein [Gracilibacillus salinarum]|uniref:DUF4064 domain-containing protein n=1 Tax=Gracilibacillus salinarum TaxID=2932255 RepID=A0ABY4GSX8_9BACI|nr:hypothetical protein [Gracilibacillus salinarum]UOQ87321.1 hypothetical protein MUN87_10730 [Gracilibacillus salinarum]
MKRRLERILLFIGATWNVITAMLTIFSYNTWFSREGSKQLENAEMDTMIAGSQMINNISSIIFLFGLFTLIGAIVNYYLAIRLKDNEIQKGLLTWIGIWTVVQLGSMDIIGFVIYMFAFIFYLARNKAIKLSNKQLRSAVNN